MHSLYYTAEIFQFFNLFQFAECIAIDNEIFASYSVKFVHTVNKLVTPVSSSFHEVSNIMAQTYAVAWLAQFIQEQINNSNSCLINNAI